MNHQSNLAMIPRIPGKVLVVDDESAIRRNLGAGLSDLGYSVTLATDGKEGLEVFKSGSFDIVLVDLWMPVLNGMGFIEELVKVSASTPVIVVSGSGTLHDAIKAIRMGAWDYVVKPVEQVEELDIVIQRNLERARLLEENYLHKTQLEGLVVERTQKLLESEQRLRSLGDNLPNGMVYQLVREPDGKKYFLHVSAGVEKVHGHNAAAVMADASLLYNQIVEADRAVVQQAEEESFRSMSVFNATIQIRRVDGQYRWLQLWSAPRKVAGLGVVWDGIEIDVTDQHRGEEIMRELLTEAERARGALLSILEDQKQTEDQLRFSEERFRNAMQYSPIGKAIVGLDGRWLEVNSALLNIVGYNREELLNLTFLDITHPEDVDISRTASRGLEEGVIPSFQAEKRYIHKNGHFVWVQINVSVVRDAAGNPSHFVSQVQDITQRRSMQQNVLESQTRLMLALDMTKMAHWELDLVTQMFTFDERFYRLHGTTVEREGGSQMSVEECFKRFVPVEDHHLVHAVVQSALNEVSDAGAHQMEHRIIRRDGAIRVMAVRYTVIRDALGKPIRVFGANQDVTDQKEAEAKRKELERQVRQTQKLEALGTLAGGIAHDFNNILGAIISFTELARMDNPNNPELQDYLRQVLQASNRATHLVRQILSFSRQQKQERKSIQLTAVVREALKLLRSTLPSTIEIEQVIPADLPNVMADSTHVHQVLMNLCTNAAHAMRGRQGKLTVRMERASVTADTTPPHPALKPQEYLKLTIADTGHGMDEDTLRRIFEPFFTTKGPNEGTGLGLAVVHGIIQDHEGVISVASKFGEGTTFTIYLPAIRAVESAAVAAEQFVPTGQGETILFVDDEAALCEVSRRMLARLGYKPVVFRNPAEAWTTFEDDPDRFAAVVTDMTMPGMTGLELSEKILSIRPAIPIVVTSGFTGGLTEENVRSIGISGLIHKPLDHAQFGAALHRALTQSSRRT